MAKSEQNDLAILGRIKKDRTKNAVVQKIQDVAISPPGCRVPRCHRWSTREMRCWRSHTKRRCGSHLPPIAAIPAPKTISRLSCDSGIGPFGLSHANGLDVPVVEQRGWVGFPAVVEIPRFTRTIVKVPGVKLGLHELRRACNQWCSIMWVFSEGGIDTALCSANGTRRAWSKVGPSTLFWIGHNVRIEHGRGGKDVRRPNGLG